ncbi:hypothetical protein EG329_013858 [Mollisiaceae sp. DMI_Dod_QoI]|nr:hypothetical protein EG329_013858 [Helotiales sp. DMI_Dod_QoI]
MVSTNISPVVSEATQPDTSQCDKKPYLVDELGSEIVLLRIGSGENAQSLPVHKKILCTRAPFFEKMFNGPFAEGVSQSAEFPEDNPTAFKLLIGWIYTQHVEDPYEFDTARGLRHCSSRQIIALYALAEKYNILRLQDQSMDHLVKHCIDRKKWLFAQTMGWAYENTHANSKLRLYVARHFVFVTLCSQRGRDKSWTDDIMRSELMKNEDLFKDVFALLRDYAGKMPSDPNKALACDYHQHSSTEPCPYQNK